MQPDLENIEVTDWIAVGSAFVLFVCLFLPWTRVKAGMYGYSVTGTTGASFGWLSIIAVLAVFAMFVIKLFNLLELPFPGAYVYLGAGAWATLFSGLVMLVRPGADTAGFGGVSISKIPWYGSWFGALASVLILVAGFLMWKEER